MAVALVLTTAFVTMPLSAADFATTRPVIGSVNAIGSVDLRGVGISEGTLFSGDNIRSNAKGYAKVLIGTGSKIELSEKTDVRVNRDARGVQIAMNSGIVSFTARTPLRIDVAPFEVTASDDASGNVAIMSTTTAGVRALNGKVMVRNLKTSESFVLTQGQEQLLGLKDGVHGPSLGEIATNVPGPIPSPKPAPQTPAGKTSGGGLAMDTGAWLAVIGGAAVAGIAIWGVLSADHANDRVDALTNQLAQTNFNVAANNVATQAQLKAITNLVNISLAVAQQSAALSQATALAVQAQLALQASGNTSAAQQFANLQAQIAANQATLNTLSSQISAAQAAVAAGTPGAAAQLASLLSQEENARTQTNNLLGQERTLLNNNQGNGVPNGNNVPGNQNGPTITSASTPV